MQAESGDRGTTLALELSQPLHVDPIPDPPYPAPGALAQGDAPTYRRGVDRREKRLIRRQRVLTIRLSPQPMTLEHPGQTPRHPDGHTSDLRVVRWGQRKKTNSTVPIRDIHTVKGQRVEMNVRVERIAKSLDERYRSALQEPHLRSRNAIGPSISRAPAVGRKDRLDKDPQDVRRHARVIRHAIT